MPCKDCPHCIAEAARRAALPRERPCQHCGAIFDAKVTRTIKWCSPHCALFAKVDTSGGPDACRPRSGYANHDGYRTVELPVIGTVGAHRLSWALVNGDIPSGLVVRHRCDNPPCCNPAHLELGTDAENEADKARRGRLRVSTRLTPRARAGHRRRERMKSRAKRRGITLSEYRARIARGEIPEIEAEPHGCGPRATRSLAAVAQDVPVPL